MISGAVYRAVISRSSVVLVSDPESRAIVARPRSAIFALPSASTSMFACADHNQHGYGTAYAHTHSFEVSMDHIM